MVVIVVVEVILVTAAHFGNAPTINIHQFVYNFVVVLSVEVAIAAYFGKAPTIINIDHSLQLQIKCTIYLILISNCSWDKRAGKASKIRIKYFNKISTTVYDARHFQNKFKVAITSVIKVNLH